MRHGTRKPHRLKVRHYVEYMVELNDYLEFLLCQRQVKKNGDMKLNKILLKIMPNSWIRQTYVKGFDF